MIDVTRGSRTHHVRWVGITSLVIVAVIAAAIMNPFRIGESSASPASDIAPGVAFSQSSATPVTSATPVAPFDCEALAPGVGSEIWIRTELYFGVPLATPGQMLSEEELQSFLDNEWQAFLDTEITPRFPDGLTVLSGYGQYLNSSGVISREDSIVLIIFIPADAVPTASASIEEIRDAYKTQFKQESVLRTDAEPVCISF